MARYNRIDAMQHVAALLSQAPNGIAASDAVTKNLNRDTAKRLLEKLCEAGHAEKYLEPAPTGGAHRWRYDKVSGRLDVLEDIATSPHTAARFLEEPVVRVIPPASSFEEELEEPVADEAAPNDADVVSRHLVAVVGVLEAHTAAVSALKETVMPLSQGLGESAALYAEEHALTTSFRTESREARQLLTALATAQLKELKELRNLVTALGHAVVEQSEQIATVKNLVMLQAAMSVQNRATTLRETLKDGVRVFSGAQEKDEDEGEEEGEEEEEEEEEEPRDYWMDHQDELREKQATLLIRGPGRMTVKRLLELIRERDRKHPPIDPAHMVITQTFAGDIMPYLSPMTDEVKAEMTRRARIEITRQRDEKLLEAVSKKEGGA